ncbi:hypothetical protein [Pleurocapsa sp. FMAR1]|uniref:hypothetical protein n=1 Tax=Pleurocapsa sp. FMAR1 TaxID=3040204 RepID=UPI0029C973E3|nr:hypothetical protein [Pleurocapsa sp. FMAR1]
MGLWLISSFGGWQELSKKYQTENSPPTAFYKNINQRVSFRHEQKSGSLSLSNLCIGVSDEGLYLAVTSPFNILYPSLLVSWNDIAYRQGTNSNSSDNYFTFYLGNPYITSFPLGLDVIEKLSEDYGEPIFLNKLGEPS